MEAAEFYRRTRNLPEDWDIDWGSTEWNWFKIGWDSFDLSQNMRDQDIADCLTAFHDSHPKRVNGSAPFASVLHSLGWLGGIARLAR